MKRCFNTEGSGDIWQIFLIGGIEEKKDVVAALEFPTFFVTNYFCCIHFLSQFGHHLLYWVTANASVFFYE